MRLYDLHSIQLCTVVSQKSSQPLLLAKFLFKWLMFTLMHAHAGAIIRGGGASEQLGGARRTCKTRPTRGVWGHAPPRKFSNLHALRLNLEPSGGI